MPKPRITAPRGLLIHAELFGRPGDIEWIRPSSIDEYVGLRAAEVQHHSAVEIVERLRAREQTAAWLEERTGIASGRISKLLRGHAHMTLRDLQAIEGILGPVLITLRFDRTRIEDSGLLRRFDRDAERWGSPPT